VDEFRSWCSNAASMKSPRSLEPVNAKINARKIRELDLKGPVQLGRPHFLSAASGLVHVGHWLYVVADDENHLAVFDDRHGSPGTTIRVFGGDLPLEKKPRKKVKPDLEALVRIVQPVHAPQGALLLVPSGSKAHRNRGAILPLDATGAIAGSPRELSFARVMECLPFDPPNIEAAFFFDEKLCLLNRGNKKNQPNAFVTFDLGEVLGALLEGKNLSYRQIFNVDIGFHEKVPFTLTDASVAGDEIVFTAAAEETEDSYEDGPTGAAGIGVLRPDGTVTKFFGVSPAHKLEGISARRVGEKIHCLLVNDEDDPEIPSSLLECQF